MSNKFLSGFFGAFIATLFFVAPVFSQPPNLLSLSAKSELDKGNFAPAIAELNTLISQNPKNIDAFMLKAAIRTAEGVKYYDVIDQEYSAVVAIDPNYWQAYAKAGEVCLEGKGWSCEKYFAKVKALKPELSAGYVGYAKGIVYGMVSSDYKSRVERLAIPALMKAIEIDRLKAPIYLQLGKTFEKIAEPAKAIDAFTAAIAADPRSHVLYSLRGDVKNGANDLAGAVADYTKSIALNQDYVPALTGRAAAFEKSADLVKAVTDLDRVLTLEPKNIAARLSRGKIHSSEKRYPAALADLDFVVKYGNETEAECGYTYRGLAKLRQGDVIAAEKDIIQVWENGGAHNRPCYGVAAYHMGNFRFARGKYLWAETAYRNALKSYDTPEVRASLAKANEYYSKYESSAAQNNSSNSVETETSWNAPKNRTGSPERYRQAARAYEKAIDDFNRMSQSYTSAVQKYNDAGEARFLYKGTLERAFRSLEGGRSILQNLLRDHGDYLPQNRIEQVESELENMPVTPYSG